MENQQPENSSTDDEVPEGHIDRRAAIKKGVVGAAVAGVIWTAPKIEGLSLRPNYAAAGTGGGGPFNVTIPIAAGAYNSTFAPPSGADAVSVTRFAGGSADIQILTGGGGIAGTGGNVNSANVDPADWTVFASANGPFLSDGVPSASGQINATYNCF